MRELLIFLECRLNLSQLSDRLSDKRLPTEGGGEAERGRGVVKVSKEGKMLGVVGVAVVGVVVVAVPVVAFVWFAGFVCFISVVMAGVWAAGEAKWPEGDEARGWRLAYIFRASAMAFSRMKRCLHPPVVSQMLLKRVMNKVQRVSQTYCSGSRPGMEMSSLRKFVGPLCDIWSVSWPVFWVVTSP